MRSHLKKRASLDRASLKRRYCDNLERVWQRYLDSVPPTDRSIRWAYYETLVQRYKISITLGASCVSSGVLWLLAPCLGYVLNIQHDVLTPAVELLVAFALVGVGVGAILLISEASSWSIILHFHRIHLLRGNRKEPSRRRW